MSKLRFNKEDNRKTRNRLTFIALALILVFFVYNNKNKIFKKNDAVAVEDEKPVKDEGGKLTNPDKVKETNNQATKEANNTEGTTPASNNKDAVRYAVVSTNDVATAVAMKVLEEGGNAVDAAVALSFALNITDPQNSGIGGGGGMLVYDPATNKKVFYDYYISSGDVEPIDNVGIPGFLKGMDQITKDLGSMPLSDVLKHPIELAEKGVVVTEGYEDILSRFNYIGELYPPVLREDGQLLREGDIFRQDDLITTLKEIRDNGVDVFYGGQHEISKNFLTRTGISPESLAAYKVNISEPLELDYRGYKIMAPKGPFAGLTALQSLIIEENVDIPAHDMKSNEFVTKFRDIYRFTARDGRKEISDPDFYTADYQTLLNKETVLKRYREYNGSEEFYEEPESESTTSFSVIDKNGMMVSGTNTISNFWGSYVIENGIIYNNAMKNFSGGVNKFEFNKRPKTGISPMIITRDDGYIETLGSNGGAKIPFYLTEYIINTKKYNMTLQNANDLERLHYLKGLMHFEKNAPLTTYENDAELNFADPFITIDSGYAWGIMNGIQITPDGQITTHIDKRHYLKGGGAYINGANVYPDPTVGANTK